MVDFAKKLSELRAQRKARGQDSDLYEEPKASEILAQGPIKAWFRNHKGEVYSKDLTYEIREEPHHIGIGQDGSRWTVFQLRGGPTGWESFVLSDDRRPIEEVREGFQTWGYWSACAGNHVYAECRVHVSELDRVLDAFVASHPDEKLYQD